MEVHQRTIKGLSRNSVVNVVLFSCTHFGHSGIAYKKLNREIEKTQDTSNTYWTHLGDSGEYIGPSDPRWDIGALDPDFKRTNLVDLQVDRAIDVFHPIRHRCLGFIMGNHEDKYVLHTGSNPGSRIAHSLGIPFLGYTALVRLNMKLRTGQEWKQTLFLVHGSGTRAKTAGGQMSYLQKISKPFEHDVAGMGHVHRRGCDNNEVALHLNDAADDVNERQRHYIITGTFMRTYFVRLDGQAGYGEKKMYPPSALGCSSIEFHVGERVVRAKDYWS